jgi:hypothetical protein
MEERELEASVYEYLVLEKAYPKSELLVEAVLGPGSDGKRYHADLAVLDSSRSEIIALIEVKRSRDHKALRAAISQLLHYRRVLGKAYVPIYLFFRPISGSGKQFEIAQVLPDGNTKDIYPAEFPAYGTLISGDKSTQKASRTVAVRDTYDRFQVTCICLAVVVAIVLVLDVSKVLQLSIKQLTLAGISGALLILPFAAKFKMLGVEFERRTPDRAASNEP